MPWYGVGGLSLPAWGPSTQCPVPGWDPRLPPLTLPTLPSHSCPPSGCTQEEGPARRGAA